MGEINYQVFKNVIKSKEAKKKAAKAQRKKRRQREKILSWGSCVFCGATEDLTIDHIIPLSRGGTDAQGNKRCLCARCNLWKGDRMDYELVGKVPPWKKMEGRG